MSTSTVADLSALGDEVRRQRQARGLTIKGLAAACGLSERFVSDLERGVGNISIARLVAVAVALDAPVTSLVAPLDRAKSGKIQRRAIAMVGLRGAGKSTIGARVADALGYRFAELDQAIESRAALPLGQIFEIHGEAYYRRLERESLLELLGKGGEGPRQKGVVIATGGGIVTDDDSWSLLRKKTRTVWLAARPEDHYARVMAQGDLRPMKNRPAAMAELRALLGARRARYAEAELTIETSSTGLDGAVAEVVAWASGDALAVR